MSKNQNGATFLEILVSLMIVAIITIMLFQTIDYTITARKYVETTKKGIEYSETFTKLFIDKLREKEISTNENLIDYLSETSNQRQILEETYELENYQYSFILLEEAALKEGVQGDDLMKGRRFSTEDHFDFTVFQDLIDREALMMNRPNQKEVQAKSYEGLVIEMTEQGEMIIRQNVVRESDRICMEMEVNRTAEGWMIDIHPKSPKLDESKAIHIVMNTAYFDTDNQTHVILNNNTACSVMIELRGKRALGHQMNIINKNKEVPFVVYESQLDYPIQGYILIGLVTKKNHIGENQVLKQSLFYL